MTSNVAAPAPVRVRSRLRLVLLSFLMLFVELVLIRWSAANVVYLAYFTNFVLLASFLGIGIGFLRADRSPDLFRLVPWLVAAYTAFLLLFPVQVTRADGRSFSGLFGSVALPMWVSLPAIFIGVVVILAGVAQGVARTFVMFSPLEAYRLDIAGSILGIAAFSLLSFLGTPPIVWGLVVAALLLVVRDPPAAPPIDWPVALVVVGFALASLSPLDRWSPYYRVSVDELEGQGVVGIRVNGLPHQSMSTVERLRSAQPFYFLPYRHLPGDGPGDVLIVGAGSGNDVAVALSEGADRIDAVEIDPVILDAGRALHPDRPYQDPRVRAVVNDGRAFMERTDSRYDLILFALPDSLTLVSGQSSLRLESYLFTREAIEEVRNHLRAGGVFAMYNYYRPHVLDRFAATMESVFGAPPCVELGEALGPRSQAVLVSSLQPGALECSAAAGPLVIGEVPAATDDHPFPYLQSRTIPRFYVLVLTLVLAASVLIVRFTSGGLVGVRAYADLFLMGAAFLLLGTKNVVQFALLFGTTWFVNALVFAGILIAVYLAVEVARRVRLNLTLSYLLLLGALAVAWAVPSEALLALPLAPRFLIATAIAFGPVFLANLVFAERFRSVHASAVAFGTNLLGAMFGGVLEYSALVVGYRSLLVVAAALYGVAWIVMGRRVAAA